jgi:formylglycine-generating enzyme required for sulfatase activity
MTVSSRRSVAKTLLLTTLAFTGGCSEKGTSAADSLPKTISVDLGGGVTMELVLIRDGSFTMGSESQSALSDDKPAHTVTISKPFYQGKYEVTQEQSQAVMGNNPSDPSELKGPRLPVDSVSWNDCQEFIKKLQSKSPGLMFSLPTEAQWEYACRAGSKTDYSFGDDGSRLGDYAWYKENSLSITHMVGGKQPNAWGLYDIHGNVEEWCTDWYGEYSSGAQKDPAGPSSGQLRVVRGGSCGIFDTFVRSASRLADSPDRRYYYYYGVRVAAGT